MGRYDLTAREHFRESVVDMGYGRDPGVDTQ